MVDDVQDEGVREQVIAAGRPVPTQFRAAMKDELTAALRGERAVKVVEPLPSNGRGWWMAAAAAVVVVGVVTTVLVVGDGDDGTVTPAPTESAVTEVPTTDVPETDAPTTLPDTTAASTAPSVETTFATVPSATSPLPDPNIPLLSVDAQLPTAILGPVIASVAPIDTRAAAIRYAVFQADGWTVWQQATEGEISVQHHLLDGTPRWTVMVPQELQGATRTGDMEIGPRDVLYAYYEAAAGRVTVAIATSGVRAGEIVASWDSDPSCFETGCGPAMGVDGVRISGGTSPYVDQSGKPLPGATFTYPERGGHDDRLGPDMPSDWPRDDGSGGTLVSNRTTFVVDGRSWTFDAMGVPSAIYDFDYLGRRVFADGTALVWFTTYDGAGTLATRQQQFLGVLFADGRSSFVKLPANVVDVTGHGGLVYVTTLDEATQTYELRTLATG